MCLSVLIDDKNIWAAPCPIMSPCPRCLYVQLYIREQIIARSAAAAVCAEILSAHQRMHTKDKAVSVNISKPGDHWKALMDLLPAYRSISYVKLGDGKATSFSEDHWLPLDATLSVTFPALHSHFKGADMSVHEVMGRGVQTLLQVRLTPGQQTSCKNCSGCWMK